MPLSNIRSNTSIRLEPPDWRSTAIEGLLQEKLNSISHVCDVRLACSLLLLLPALGAEQAVAHADRKSQAKEQLSWCRTSTSSAQSVQLCPLSRPANGCEWSTIRHWPGRCEYRRRSQDPCRALGQECRAGWLSRKP